MAELLTDLLEAGLIENLGGDDERFAKIERAAGALAQELCANPPALIRAILAGLDPDIPPDDPAIAMAERVLLVEWKSVRSVFPDTPMGLLRAILLEACRLAASEGNNAAILWLTAADTLPLLRLGREESVIQRILVIWSAYVEEKLAGLSNALLIKPSNLVFNTIKSEVSTPLRPRKIDRVILGKKLGASIGNLTIYGQPADNPNPNWPYQQSQSWSIEFFNRMHTLLADELDALASDMGKYQIEADQKIQVFQTEITKILNDALNFQQHQVQETLQSDQLHLKSLWWSEALYSPSLRKSYREIPPPLAATVMAVDILAEVAKPTPASVGYLLAEAVNRLPEAGFERKFTLTELFHTLREARGQLHKGWLQALVPPPDQGRLSLRDAAWLALARHEQELAALMPRIGASEDVAMSLPAFAHALFRQEQAVQLAGSR